MRQQERRHSSRPRTRTLVIAGAIVVLALVAFDQLAQMDGRFFGRSPQALRALVHYLAGDYAGAARSYREVLRRHAESTNSAQAPSWVALARGDLDQAELEAQVESRLAPADPEPLLTLAEAALARRNDPAALTLAGRVLELRRDDYDALLVTAVVHARRGADHAAIDALKRALRYDRAERRYTVFLAVLEVTGELDEPALEQRPNCLLAHLHRYLRIYDPSQERAASRYAERAIANGDRSDDAHVTLGLIHIKQGRPTRAFAAFQQALAINPRNTAALLWAARYHANRGEIAEEYRLIRAALEAARDDPFVVASLHSFLVDKAGDYGEALALAETAVAVNPRDAEAWWRRGHVQALLGQHHLALESYQQAVTLAPHTAELEENIGNILAELARDEEALAAYQRAGVLNPLRPQPHLGLGRLYGRTRRWSEAIQEYETAARLGGGLNVDLCQLYWETGRLGDTARCVTAVLTVDPDNVLGLALMEHVRGARQAASHPQ
jgi:tetratricopeptide (TPR) repeat protein